MKRVLPLVLMMAAGLANAGLTTYDFTGVGQLCVYVSGVGSCSEGNAFSGSITLDVDPAAHREIVSDPFSDSSYAYSRDGWVDPHFEFSWAGGAFASVPVPDEGSSAFSHMESAELVDDPSGFLGGDTLTVSYQSRSADTLQIRAANLGAYWQPLAPGLPNLVFPEPLQFAELDSAWISFSDISSVWILEDPTRPHTSIANGASGVFLLNSLAPRSVPEPGTFALLGCGLLAMLLCSRRRTALLGK